MKISRLLSLLAILALSAATTQAANITWGSATNIAGDSDVSTTGTLLGAVMFSPAFTVANQTINGVTFTDVDPFSTSSSGVFSFPGINVGNSFLPATPPFSLLSVPYQNMLSTTASSAFTLTMSGLTPGATYAFQVWANYSSIAAAAATTMALAGNAIVLDQNTTDVAGGLGQFVIGTFTADAATQQVAFSGRVNAVQLRELSQGATVPEAGSSIALLFLSAGALFGASRLRSLRLGETAPVTNSSCAHK